MVEPCLHAAQAGRKRALGPGKESQSFPQGELWLPDKQDKMGSCILPRKAELCFLHQYRLNRAYSRVMGGCFGLSSFSAKAGKQTLRTQLRCTGVGQDRY